MEIMKLAKATDKKQSTALAKTTNSAVSELKMTAKEFATVAFSSGYYKDCKKVADVYLKMTIAASLGLDPASAMSSVILVNGRPSFTSALISARIITSGRYRYEVLEKTDQKCTIQIYSLIEDYTDTGKAIKRWVKAPAVETFTAAMAKRAGLPQKNAQVWAAYPEAMLFARALTSAARTYCADVMFGSAIYSPEELGCDVVVDSDGDVVASPEVVQAQAKAVEEVVQDAEFTETPDSSVQFALLQELIVETKTDPAPHLKLYGCSKLEELTINNIMDFTHKLKLKKAAQ